MPTRKRSSLAWTRPETKRGEVVRAVGHPMVPTALSTDTFLIVSLALVGAYFAFTIPVSVFPIPISPES